MRVSPGMTDSIDSIRRSLTEIDELIIRSRHTIREARETLRCVDDLLERHALTASSKRRERPD
jgi:hypothetical protein